MTWYQQIIALNRKVSQLLQVISSLRSDLALSRARDRAWEQRYEELRTAWIEEHSRRKKLVRRIQYLEGRLSKFVKLREETVDVVPLKPRKASWLTRALLMTSAPAWLQDKIRSGTTG